MNPMSEPPGASPPRDPLERFLCLFADVRAGEGLKAMVLMLNVFLLLTCYYMIKPLREALILPEKEGPELRSYLSAAMALLLLILVPAYSALASRVNRIKLITIVTLLFVTNLLVFFALARAQTRHLGIPFFIWVGIFNLGVIAQFWSFANDLYSPDQGKRLFPIVAFGATAGGIVGAWATKLMIVPLGIYVPMLFSAGLLAICTLLFLVAHRLDRRDRQARVAQATAPEESPLGKRGAFQLVLSDRYLLLIALLVLILNFVNTNGEYILAKTFKAMAERMIADRQTAGMSAEAFEKQVTGLFYAGYQLWFNVVAALIQLFVVSRVFKWFGVRVALFFLPMIALFGYSLMAWIPVLQYIRLAKIAENATEYSLNNTARHALFLPTSREAKYKAKAAIDTFPQRMGDVLSAILVWAGTRLALTGQNMAAINLALIGAWLLIVMGIARRHRRLVEGTGGAAAAP